jgi:hypothetical protein
MGEDGASRVPRGDGLAKGDLGKLERRDFSSEMKLCVCTGEAEAEPAVPVWRMPVDDLFV